MTPEEDSSTVAESMAVTRDAHEALAAVRRRIRARVPEHQVYAAIEVALGHGVPWSKIGAAIGMSGEAARHRYTA
jgi:hypothetical protein